MPDFSQMTYLEDVIGDGFDIGVLGQQEAARKDAAAATMRILAIFIIVVSWLSCSSTVTGGRLDRNNSLTRRIKCGIEARLRLICMKCEKTLPHAAS
jgi:hypothetical protein